MIKNSEILNNRILIIDDNEQIHDDIRKTLFQKSGGNEVEDLAMDILNMDSPVTKQQDLIIDSAFQGEEGVKMVQKAIANKTPYALAFVDVRIPPGLDGIQTIQELQKLDSELQYVVITAFSDYDWGEIHDRIGITSNLLILKKPFDSIEIRQISSALLEKWNLSRQQQRATMELCESKQRLLSIFEAMNDGVSIITHEYEIEYLNSALVANFGKVNGRKCYNYFQGRTEICPWCNAQEVFGGETVHVEWNTEVNDKVYDQLSTPLKGSGGNVSNLVIFRDITEKKKLQQLRQYESLKNMAGAIAHRFNNLMMVIQGYLEILNETLVANSTEQRMTVNALKGSHEASKIGKMLLTYLGQTYPHLHVEDLSQTFHRAATEQEGNLPETLSLEIIPSATPLNCNIDQEQIRKTFSAILSNAIEAVGEEKGKILVSFGKDTFRVRDVQVPFQNNDLHDGEYNYCRIEDTGHGISPENMEHIFEPFFTTRFVGRGMGLALTVGVMQTHGGALIVKSRPGSGTVVTMLLPVTEDHTSVADIGLINRLVVE